MINGLKGSGEGCDGVTRGLLPPSHPVQGQGGSPWALAPGLDGNLSLWHSAAQVQPTAAQRPAWPAQLPSHPDPCLTQAAAALAVRLQHPALIAGALHTELVLVALLAALEVLGAVALDLAGVVVRPQLHAQRARAHNAFARCHRAVVTAATVIERALVWGVGSKGSGSGSGRRQDRGLAGPQVPSSRDGTLAPCLWRPSFHSSVPLLPRLPQDQGWDPGTHHVGPTLSFPRGAPLHHGCISLWSLFPCPFLSPPWGPQPFASLWEGPLSSLSPDVGVILGGLW